MLLYFVYEYSFQFPSFQDNVTLSMLLFLFLKYGNCAILNFYLLLLFGGKLKTGRFDKAAAQTNALAQQHIDKQIPVQALDTFFRIYLCFV